MAKNLTTAARMVQYSHIGKLITEIGKNAWLFAKLKPGRARKRIKAT